MCCSKSRLNPLGGALVLTAAFWAVMLASSPRSSANSSQEVRDTPLETTAIVPSEQSAAIESSDGEVYLIDSPFCEFFVIKTVSGFSLLGWRGGHFVFSEGDLVRGALTVTGLHQIDFAGDDPMRVDIEAVGVSLGHAQRVYYSRCHTPRGSERAGQVK